MLNSILRKVIVIVFAILIVCLLKFTSLESNIITTIGIIMLFLVIFNYILGIDGFGFLRSITVLFIFIILPVLLLINFGIVNLFGFWISALICALTFIFGIFIMYVLVELNNIEVEYIDDELNE